MFSAQAFRAHQREPVSISLVNVDMTPEQRFAELCLNGVMQYCLSSDSEQEENFDFSS